MTGGRLRRPGRRRVLAGLLLLGVAGAVRLRPAPPVDVPAAAGAARVWRGAYHVHSTRSDGSGTPDAIARAAARTGLDFVILTDHGDGTRTPDHRYVDGVLLVDAVEVSTEEGHLVALGLPAAPYPLAGEARAVVEDVRRLGGTSLLAHPDSPLPALSWHDWSVEADGFEWVNADSSWREADALTLAAHLLRYPLGRSAALASLSSYPSARVAERDDPRRPAPLALAAVDAHARIGLRRAADPQDGGRTLAAFPSYDASFGTFGLVVPWQDEVPTGDATADAARVVDAIRRQRASSSVFAMTSGSWVTLEVSDRSLTVRAAVPEGASIRLLRNGSPWKTVSEGETVAVGPEPATYRAEAWLPARRGWPSIPIALGGAVRLPAAEDGATPSEPAPVGVTAAALTWHAEHDPRSSVQIDDAARMPVQASVTLAPGARVSQFAALVGDLMTAPPPDAEALVVELRADAPMRVSVQLREPRPGDGLRWRHSAYVDGTTRRIRWPIEEFRPIAPATGRPPLERLHALLLVMDTVNAHPGTTRTLTVSSVGWQAGSAARGHGAPPDQ